MVLPGAPGGEEDVNVDVGALDAHGPALAYGMAPQMPEAPPPVPKPGRQRPTNNQLL